MRTLPGKESPAHTETLGAHGDLSAQGADCKPCPGSDWEETLGPCSSPIPQTLCLWVLLVAGTEMGPHKRALNAPSQPPYTNLRFPSHQHHGTKTLLGQSHLRNTWMRAQQVLLEKQEKHFPCPFPLPAPGLIVGQVTRDSTPGAPLFHRISVAPCTHLSMSPPPAQGAPILQPPWWHETRAGASPPWPPCRGKHQQGPPKNGLAPLH